MSSDNVIQFPTQALRIEVAPSLERGAVEVQADGRVRLSPEVSLDDASREFWEAVEEHVLGAWTETALPRERLRVRLLTTYLDRTDPQWRTKIREILGG